MGRSESNASLTVSCASGLSWSGIFHNLFFRWALLCRGVQIVKHSGLHCLRFRMDDLLSFVLKNIQQWAVIEFLTRKNETPITIHRKLLALHGAFLGEKIRGQWRKFGPERPVAAWKLCYHNSRFKQAYSLRTYTKRKKWRISQSAVAENQTLVWLVPMRLLQIWVRPDHTLMLLLERR